MPPANTRRYIANPDVSCREEGPDGAILFNPDSDQVLLVNPTGLVIWRAMEQPRTMEGVVAFLIERCECVPEEEIQQDVEDFITTMIAKGFIGTWQEG